MTDRDGFAAAALSGLLSRTDRYQVGVVVRQAYELADEMLRFSKPPDAAILSDDEIAALKHAIVWLPPAYNPQHATLKRLLERAAVGAAGSR